LVGGLAVGAAEGAGSEAYQRFFGEHNAAVRCVDQVIDRAADLNLRLTEEADERLAEIASRVDALAEGLPFRSHPVFFTSIEAAKDDRSRSVLERVDLLMKAMVEIERYVATDDVLAADARSLSSALDGLRATLALLASAFDSPRVIHLGGATESDEAGALHVVEGTIAPDGSDHTESTG
jgi:hypothetical protein